MQKKTHPWHDDRIPKSRAVLGVVKCTVRGCRNKSWVLYSHRVDTGLVRDPICSECLRRITDEEKDLRVRERQLLHFT